jgi:hypothetical protein
VYVQLITNAESIVTRRELFTVLNHGARDRAGGIRKHLALTISQSDLGFANELAACPRQHQGQQADEKQLAAKVHLVGHG